MTKYIIIVIIIYRFFTAVNLLTVKYCTEPVELLTTFGNLLHYYSKFDFHAALPLDRKNKKWYS